MSLFMKPHLTSDEELEQSELLQSEISERMPTKLGDFNNHPLYVVMKCVHAELAGVSLTLPLCFVQTLGMPWSDILKNSRCCIHGSPFWDIFVEKPSIPGVASNKCGQKKTG